MRTIVPLSTIARLLTLSTLTSMVPTQWAGVWPLDQTSGTLAVDIAPQANHGTLVNFTGTPWVAGMIGNGLVFDGVDDHVEIPVSGQFPVYDGLGSPYTFACWIKAPAQPDRRVYSEGNDAGGTGTGALFTLGSHADKFRIFIRTDAVQVVCSGASNAVVFDDTWHHVALTEVSGQITLYVDGVFDRNITYAVGRGPGTPGDSFTLNKIALGAVLRNNVCCAMTGILDEVRVYDFACSAADVALMMAGVPLTPIRASIGDYGVGCGVGPFDLTGGGSAVLGGPGIQLQMQSGPPNAVAFWLCGFGTLAPIDLAQYGFNGCIGYPANFVSFVAGVLDGSGAGPGPVIPVPNDPGLAFVQLNCQAAALAATTIEFSDVVVSMLGN